MTEQEYQRNLVTLAMVHRRQFQLAGELAGAGVATTDILIASLYSLQALAGAVVCPLDDDSAKSPQAVAISKAAAIEWIRTAIDGIERRMLDEVAN